MFLMFVRLVYFTFMNEMCLIINQLVHQCNLSVCQSAHKNKAEMGQE